MQSPTAKKTVFPLISREAAALLCLALTLLVFRAKAVGFIGSHYLGGATADAGLYVWLSKISLFHAFDFSTPAFYPYGRSLAWSDNFLFPSLLVQGFTALGLSHVTSYNLVFFAAQLCGGYFAFRLAYFACKNFWAALLSGLSILVCTAFSAHLGHPQLQFYAFYLFGFEFLLRFFFSQRGAYLLGAGLCISLSFLCAVYWAVFLALTAALVLGVYILLRGKTLRGADLSIAAGFFIAGCLPCIFFALPYLDVKETFGPRGLYEAFYFAASGLSYLSFSPFFPQYSAFSALSHSEAHLGNGFSFLVLTFAGALLVFRIKDGINVRAAIYAMLLAITCSTLAVAYPQLGRTYKPLCALFLWISLGFFIRWFLLCKKRRPLSISPHPLFSFSLLGFVGLTFFALSFGPLGNPEKGEMPLGPFSLFYYLMPGFDAVRASARCGLVAILCLCLCLSQLYAKLLTNKRPVFKGAFAVCFLGFLAESFLPYYPLEPLPAAPPILNTALRETRPRDISVALPLSSMLDKNSEVVSWTEYAVKNVNYMNWFADYGLSLINGYSGQRSKLMKELPRSLQDFPDERSLRALSSFAGLKYILAMHPKQSIADSPMLRIIAEDAQAVVFEFSPNLSLQDVPYIFIPPHVAGTLLMRVRSLDGFRKTLELSEDSDDAPISLGVCQIQLTEQWHTCEVAVPETENRVRPRRIRIEADEVVLQGVHFGGAEFLER